MSGIRSVACTPRVELREGWQFATAAAGSTPDRRQDWNWQPASVPGTAASALRDAGQWTWDDPRTLDAEDFWWRLHLVESGAATLGFDGIATLADVWLDGKPLLGSDNMFVAHRVAVELNGDHELLIRCRALAPELAIRRPRPRWRVPMLREQQLRWFRTSLLGRTPGWSPPCPPIGPWRPVWIEKGAPTVGEPTLDIGVEGDKGIVDVVLESGDDIESAILIFERDEQRVVSGLERHDGRWLGRLIVNDPVLWWPHTHGEPALYRAWLELVVAGVAVRLDLGQRGFRTIRIDRDAGDFRVMVNGVDVFCRGACWTPLDAVSLNAPAEAYESAVDQVRDAGMNMLRVAGPTVYEADAFYEAMDRAGILLWQDLMFANMDYPEDPGFVAGVVAEVECRHVEPRQVGRVGRPVSRARQVFVDQVDEPATVLVDDVDHRVEPRRALGPCGDGRGHRHDVGSAEIVTGQRGQRVVEAAIAGVGDRPPQPGQVERLRCRRHRHGAGRDLVAERGERDVDVARHGDVGVDLVGDHEQVVTCRDLGDPLELVPLEHVAQRVVRVAEDPDPGRVIVSEPFVEVVVVEPVAVPSDAEQSSPGRLDRVEERVVGGQVEHDAVARYRPVVDRGANALDHVDEVVDTIRVDGPAVALAHPIGEQLRCGRRRVRSTPVRVAQLVPVDEFV